MSKTVIDRRGGEHNRPARRRVVQPIKGFAAVLALLLVFLLAEPCAALGSLPEANDQPRHEVCTALSDMAQAYYTGDYRYESLSLMNGSQDISDGYKAMQDNELFSALHTLMADTHRYYTSYSGYKSGSLAYFWNSTDAVESSDTYVMFYSDVLAGTNGVKLNREHIWPKSRASFQTSNGGADLHHLRPAVDTLNNAKSNHLFGNIQGVYSDGYKEGTVNGEACYWVKSDADLFECKDDVKGDVARILLYVYCRWEQPNLYADIPTELLPANESGSTNTGVKVIESLDTLLSWCESDPVDTWEMRRNDLVESVQGNRNVFIDYPQLAWRLFSQEAPQDMITPSAKEIGHLLGDVDRDGDITVIDVTCILRHLANIPLSTDFDEAVADTDENGEINPLDATMLQRRLNHMNANDHIGKALS